MLTVFGFWPAFCLLLAYMQGVLMPAIRRTPPGKEADRQAKALHLVGTVVYFLPVFLPIKLDVAVYIVGPSFTFSLLALLSRVILFDVALNFGAGDPLFAVGKTALWDRMLRKVAPDNPDTLNGLLKLTALLVCIAAVAVLLIRA